MVFMFFFFKRNGSKLYFLKKQVFFDYKIHIFDWLIGNLHFNRYAYAVNWLKMRIPIKNTD